MDGQGGLPVFVIDGFTIRATPFSGNPAAVCLVTTDYKNLSDETMQHIAAEMKTSETSFIRCIHDTDTFETSDRFGLRWFTPVVEVALCGYGTLASAAALFHCIGNKAERLTFETLGGPLTAVRDGDLISIELPLNDPRPLQKSEQEELSGIIKALVGELKVQDVQYSAPSKKLLIRLDDTLTLEDLGALRPMPSQLPSLHSSGLVRGVIVTVKGSSADGDRGCIRYDFGSRYFAPWVGVDEDPATGSSHTVLGPYWSRVLNKTHLNARQCSLRGGDLRLTVRHDDGRVDIAGRTAVVLRGTLAISS